MLLRLPTASNVLLWLASWGAIGLAIFVGSGVAALLCGLS